MDLTLVVVVEAVAMLEEQVNWFVVTAHIAGRMVDVLIQVPNAATKSMVIKMLLLL